MTQTAQKPVQLTLTTMLAKFKEGFPSLVAPFEQIKPDLEKGTGAQVLANLIGCEVEVKAEQGLTVYSWAGRSDTFELGIPKPFEPRPQRPSETQQRAQVQEETPGAAQTPVPQAEAPPQSDPAELPGLPATAPGLFTALLGLLGDNTLLMTVAQTSKESEEPVLTVTVVPQGEETFSPICLTGSVSELDVHFIAALTAKATSRESLAEQVEALKIADQALEEAKKQEVAAKNKQTEAKKKSVQKKEEEAKAEEKKVEEKREAEKPQEKLF